MKRTTLLFAIAISMSAFFFSSCKHDYQCRCTIAGISSTTDWDNAKLSDRDDYKRQCDEDNQDAQSLGGSCEFREN